MQAPWYELLGAPSEMRQWAQLHATPAQAWQACPRGEWLLHALSVTGADRPTLILCVCDCAAEISGAPLEEDEEHALSCARTWARTLGSSAPCREAATRGRGPVFRAAEAVVTASRYWESRGGTLAWDVCAAAHVEPPDEEQERVLVATVLAQRWPLRAPSPTEIRRSEALAVAWDRLCEEVEPTATLSTVQALCSFWTALELGLDPSRRLEWDGILIRAVAERLQLVPHLLPGVREAIRSILSGS